MPGSASGWRDKIAKFEDISGAVVDAANLATDIATSGDITVTKTGVGALGTGRGDLNISSVDAIATATVVDGTAIATADGVTMTVVDGTATATADGATAIATTVDGTATATATQTSDVNIFPAMPPPLPLRRQYKTSWLRNSRTTTPT